MGLLPRLMSSGSNIQHSMIFIHGLRQGLIQVESWVYAPDRDVLEQRWDEFVQETSTERKRELFKETRDTTLRKTKNPLPGLGTKQRTKEPFSTVEWPQNQRSSKWSLGLLTANTSLLIVACFICLAQALWAARTQDQVFLVEFHSRHPKSGPGLMLSSLIPDKNSFKGGNSAKILPMLHPDGQPNVAPGLITALSRHFGRESRRRTYCLYCRYFRAPWLC